MTTDDAPIVHYEMTVTVTPEDLPAVIAEIMAQRYPALRSLPADELATALGEVLPVYGAMVAKNTMGDDYGRRERAAQSLTTRTYTAGVLRRMAFEAEQAANAGIEPLVNRHQAHMLRARAEREARG